MRPHTPRLPVRILVSVGIAGALFAPAAGAQTLADPVLRAGQARLGGGAVVWDWRERFSADGSRELLAGDLTRPSAAELVPGLAFLQDELTEVLGSGLPLRLGPSSGLVSYSELRVPLALDVGVIDRVTVGVTVPLVQSNVEADLRVATDSLADLGVNPGIGAAAVVSSYLDALQTRGLEAAGLATSLCAQSPGSPECSAATALSDDISALHQSLGTAYHRSALFPATGTSTGDALTARLEAVDTALVAQGLTAVGSTPPLAAAVADRAALQDLFADPIGPFAASAIGGSTGRWGLGDIEGRVSVRLLDGMNVDSAGAPTSAWSLAVTGTVRLPTGSADSTGVFLDRGRDDGQLDVEGAVFAALSTRRLALRAQAAYLRQQPGTFDARVVPLGEIVSGSGDVLEVELDPGDGIRLEVEPSLRLSPTLSLGLSWRWTRFGEDTFSATGMLPVEQAEGFVGVNTRYYSDPELLAEGTEFELQELGGQITYRTVDQPGNDGRGFEAFLRLQTAVSGSGGRVPAGFRGEFGLRFIRSLWGG